MGEGGNSTLFWQERMAVSECKPHFAASFPFHEVLKASGTVLTIRLVEHKQQAFGSV